MPVQQYWSSLQDYYDSLNMVDEKAEEPVSQDLLNPAESLLEEQDFRFNTPLKTKEAADAHDSLSNMTADNTEQSVNEEPLDDEETKSQELKMEMKDTDTVQIPKITTE